MLETYPPENLKQFCLACVSIPTVIWFILLFAKLKEESCLVFLANNSDHYVNWISIWALPLLLINYEFMTKLVKHSSSLIYKMGQAVVIQL